MDGTAEVAAELRNKSPAAAAIRERQIAILGTAPEIESSVTKAFAKHGFPLPLPAD